MNKTESALTLLREAAQLQPAAFSSSFGAEDMVVLDLIQRDALPIEIFTLDTGRLPEETHRLMQRVEERYGPCFKTYFPDANAVQELVARDGINGFYRSVDKRKACCAVRKLEPLGRALAGKRAWVTGLRAQQSVTRHDLARREWDAQWQVEKFNPLADWSEADVWEYIRRHDVPYNELHDRFYPSIGCAPCTRAITPGEDIRAGRWWWENADTKECGLHSKPHSVGVSSEANVRAAHVKDGAAIAAPSGRRQNPETEGTVRDVGASADVPVKEIA
ncbi:MAG TPA: phosphoadenylyl-sulfate reductase [Burkholderiaceae bacterium]|jgi:phosphoadenosine phosphosulfate reductase|nr:phosphoadenylyl-sulfate reductase [Burkholderiaceae bacterium]